STPTRTCCRTCRRKRRGQSALAPFSCKALLCKLNHPTEGWPSPVEGSGLEMRAAASRALPVRPRKRCPVRLIVRGRPGLCPAFVADPIALMGNGMGRNSTRGHPSPWAGWARAEAELPHIDPCRGVLSTELGLTRVERIEWWRERPSGGRAAQTARIVLGSRATRFLFGPRRRS